MSSLSVTNSSFEKLVTPEQEAVLEGFFKLATTLLEWRQACLYLYDHTGQLLVPFLQYNYQPISFDAVVNQKHSLPFTLVNSEVIAAKSASNSTSQHDEFYATASLSASDLSLPISVNGRLLAIFKAEAHDSQSQTSHVSRKQVLELLGEQLSVNLAITRQLNTVLNAAWIDPVTRLPNRLFLEKRLETELAYAAHRRTNVALVVLQLQNLVAVCGAKPDENYEGLPLVDFIPNHLAHLIKPFLKETDVCVRLDTNSFGLLLFQHHEVQAYRLTLKLWQAIKEDSFFKRSEAAPLDIRFGISSYPYLAGDASTLLNQATMALQPGRKESRSPHDNILRIWKASPHANPEQLVSLEDLEVCRAILQGFNYYPLLKNNYRRLDSSIIPLQFAQQNFCLPVKRQRDVLTLAMVNPVNQELVAQVARMTGYHVLPVVTSRSELEAALTYLNRTALPQVQNRTRIVPWNN